MPLTRIYIVFLYLTLTPHKAAVRHGARRASVRQPHINFIAELHVAESDISLRLSVDLRKPAGSENRLNDILALSDKAGYIVPHAVGSV